MFDLALAWPVLLYRFFKFGYPYRRIYLGENKWTILDSADYYRLRRYKWWLHGNGSNLYAARTAITSDLQSKIVFIHRQIMDPPVGLVVDHINCDSLDNRRANLRVVTQAQNMRNRRKRKNTSSRYIGVSFHKKRNHWTANIRHNGRKLWLGQFSDEIAAAHAYDAAALKYHKDFVRLNFPQES